LGDPNHVELQRALKARHITMIGMCDFDSGKSKD
jgi:amino acid permease